MERRAVRRFEKGGVDRAVIERIARLAQRTPSAGFSQGQRLVMVTDPVRRREVARICGEEPCETDVGPGSSQGPTSSRCATATVFPRSSCRTA
ncbi:MAG: hypothetical protein A2V85_10395 [Chloroflexi bacterium RBG_16_72_14]|nr:MAG: hypothetical protein A2V85_10395 [Chloroflexi bacterium RBG_16_72_14]